MAGHLDFKEASRKIMDLIVKETDYYVTAAFFIVEQNGKVLRAYAYNAKLGPIDIERLTGLSFNKHTTSLYPKYENLLGKSVVENSICESSNLADFLFPTVSKSACVIVNNMPPRAHRYISMPIKGNIGVAGVLLLGTTKDFLPEEEREVLKGFCRQIGIAMANAIAHEKIMKKVQMMAKRKTKFDQPSIKFTLRITPRIEKYLSWKIKNTEKTKADYLRGEIEKIMEEDDEFQNIFNYWDKNEG